MHAPARPLGVWGAAWRVLLALLGIALAVNGSVRLTDDAWPFGPMSQYAASPPRDATIVVTRVEGLFVGGTRVDLPLNVESTGISRAEIEARIPQIIENPSLLSVVADGWASRHPNAPRLQQLWLVQDETRLVDGKRGPTRLNELTTWQVPA